MKIIIEEMRKLEPNRVDALIRAFDLTSDPETDPSSILIDSDKLTSDPEWHTFTFEEEKKIKYTTFDSHFSSKFFHVPSMYKKIPSLAKDFYEGKIFEFPLIVVDTDNKD